MPASYEVTEWVAADGTVTNLMDIPRIGIQPGRSGAFMPPIRMAEDTVPFRHGSHVRYVSFGPRDIDLPLYVSGSDEGDLRIRLRGLIAKFNPLDDSGRLRVTRPDGTRREIFCRYSRGMEIVQDTGRYGPTHAKAVVTFRCHDPLWYDVVPQSNQFAAGAPQTFFPGTPFRLSSGTIFNTSTVITNDGDLETWPIWVITGPGNNIVLRNLDTGEKIEFVTGFALAEDESLIIDTRETQRYVRRTNLSPTPIISDVSVSTITATSVIIGWNTDIPADSWIEYGTSPGVYSFSTLLDPTLVTNHSVSITGLTEATTYYYRINSSPGPFTSESEGISEYKKIAIGSNFWPLYKGSNTVSVDMAGGSSESVVTLSFYRRYFSV